MTAALLTIQLKPKREKSARQRHPWLFSGAIDRVDGEPTSGQVVRVVDATKQFLGWAAWSPQSQIRLRFWSFEEDESIDRDWLRAKLANALQQRRSLPHSGNAQRLVHSEADGLPGLIVDRYADVLVVQILSAGMEAWRDELPALLTELTGIENLFERSDADVRILEGLEPRTGLLTGSLPETLQIEEHGISYRVDVVSGQKTGFYLDQRQNRRRVGALAADKEVLNCFCYSGGFSLSALQNGATSVVSVDSSAEALALARQNVTDNHLDEARCEWLQADVFQQLRRFRDQARQFDLIVLDPPKFAPTAQHAERASRAYKDINLWALKLLRPNGVLATFSCSGGVNAELFRKIIAGSAVDAGATAQVLESFHADLDHPAMLHFSEGEYLKGLLLRRVA